MDPFDDEEDEMDEKQDAGGRPIVRHVVKDVRSAMKLRQITSAAEAKSEMARIRADERKRKQELKAELSRIRLSMPAGEKARAHLAVAAPFYLLMLIGGFIAMLGAGAIPDEQVSVASALLTLLVTGLMSNLRSIIAESPAPEEPMNGHDDEPVKKQAPQPEKPARPFNG
jgi:hypothetical protein